MKLSRIIPALVLLGLVGLLAAAGVYGFNRLSYVFEIRHSPATPPGVQAQIARGAYLATLSDCVACHDTPGGAPYAGGLQLNTGFGIVAAANITPDPQTGIGGWTTRQFILAIREGIGDRGKRLYPAMPYNDYAKMSDQDVADIKAYLDTVPPVHHKVVANQMPFPFSVRLMMMGWNLLFFDNRLYRNDPMQTAQWNRGAYLVQGAGHCAACHTPKNFLGGDDAGAALRGYVLDGWYAPDLTGSSPVGLSNWSVADIAAYLKTGSNTKTVAAGPMAEAVHDSTQYWNDADLTATAVYLKSLPGTAAPQSPLPAAATMAAGAVLYQQNCSACHEAAGTGVPGMIPALAGSASIQSKSAASIIRTVLFGGRAASTTSNPTAAQMPAFDWKMDDAQMAAVASYIRNAWGNHGCVVNPSDIASIRASGQR